MGCCSDNARSLTCCATGELPVGTYSCVSFGVNTFLIVNMGAFFFTHVLKIYPVCCECIACSFPTALEGASTCLYRAVPKAGRGTKAIGAGRARGCWFDSWLPSPQARRDGRKTQATPDREVADLISRGLT